MHDEWPMTAVIEIEVEGKWQHYSEISNVKDAKAWIAKRSNPKAWRTRAKEQLDTPTNKV
jgi:hypothetical protein